ncbi:MAG: TetR/AcrR family transcriptional regulator [Proteobacteria bacterium]|nr:TetR/AcrR family transcriptional regulator [Pseudomonadota bacterium]
MKAALACFDEAGYEGASMKDISRRSGAANGSIYHHFGGKEGVAAAVYLAGLASYQERTGAVFSGDPGAREGVLGLVTAHLAWVEENPEWARFLASMRHAGFMGNQDPAIRAGNVEWAGRILAWKARRVQGGSLRDLAPGLFLSLVLGPCQELVRLWLEGLVPDGPAAAAETLGQAAWRAVGTS